MVNIWAIFGFLGVLAPVFGEESEVLDFLKWEHRASVERAVHTEFGEVSSGGETKNAIFQHAGVPGGEVTAVVFSGVTIPEIGGAVKSAGLVFSLGMRDGETFTTAAGVDGVRYLVKVNGKVVFSEEYREQKWAERRVSLSEYGGKTVEISLAVGPLKSSAADWSAWGEPRIMVEAVDGKVVEALRARYREGIPEYWAVGDLLEKERMSRVVSNGGGRAVASFDPELDLAVQVERLRDEVQAAVPLGPAMVVGEGAHPGNHTVVKVLNDYGVAEDSFLAFAPDVRGGVWVEVMGDAVVATPISDPCGLVRVFSRGGVLQKEIKPEGKGPYVMAVVGEKLVVAPAAFGEMAEMFDAKGDPTGKLRIGAGVGKSLQLAAKGDRLLMYFRERKEQLEVDLENGLSESRGFDFLPKSASVFPSVFQAGELWAGYPQKDAAHVFRIREDGKWGGIDVGQEENRFWICPQGDFEDEFGRFQGLGKAKHIRVGKYAHLRTEGISPRRTEPFADVPFAGEQEGALWEKRIWEAWPGLDRMWNPCFTHRQFSGAFRKWAEVKDEVTGLPKYCMVGRTGKVDGYGNWEGGFVSSTYAPAPLLEKLYVEPQRSFLREWAKFYREQPGRVPSIEPNHEHEIVVASDASVGDYNPAAIEGFFEFLVGRYGADVAKWNARFGTDFGDYFDAPRDFGRGDWDLYSNENGYGVAWLEYQRWLVNRVLAGTYREALLAGVPPEMIKCHQIPSAYAVGQGYGKGLTRISPVDYAMSCGVGYGFTRFGVFYDKPGNVVAGAHSSGFDGAVMGEFQPLTTDAEVAYKQLRYVFDHGVQAVHVLYWAKNHNPNYGPEMAKFNETIQSAMQRLIDEDPKRPGQAGGVGQVRGFVRDGEAMEIVSVGVGSEYTGLIKSVRRDGRMEGSVYVVPFYAAAGVEELPVVSLESGVENVVCGGMGAGSQVEVVVLGEKARFVVRRNGEELPGLSAEVKGEGGRVRYVVRAPNRVEGGFEIEVVCEGGGGGGGRVVRAAKLWPEIARVTRGKRVGKRHRGGVTFAVFGGDG